MNLSLIKAARLGYDAKDYRRGTIGFGDGTGAERLRRAGDIVLEFSDEEIPHELRVAANSIWNAVERENLNVLYGTTINRGGGIHESHRRSEEGWHLHFLQGDKDEAGIERNLGLVFTREGVNSTPPPLPNVYTDAYLWVRPDERGQGVASAAMEPIGQHTRGELHLPFDVDMANPAVARLVQQHVSAPLGV